MNEPPRLIDGDVEIERTLLRAWSARQPSEASRLKTLAAIGVGGALLSAGAGAIAAPTATFVSASTLKWLAALGGAALTAGAVVVAIHASRTPIPPGAIVPAHDAPAVASPATASAIAPAPPPEIAPSMQPALPAQAPSAPASPPPAQAKGASTSSLDEEIAALDRARAALARGDATAAIELVDAYDARFPAGALAQESEEIRIDALFRAAGKRAQAEKLAARFLAAHPNSPYARTIRARAAGVPSAAP